jgi:hypothetical protein
MCEPYSIQKGTGLKSISKKRSRTFGQSGKTLPIVDNELRSGESLRPKTEAEQRLESIGDAVHEEWLAGHRGASISEKSNGLSHEQRVHRGGSLSREHKSLVSYEVG